MPWKTSSPSCSAGSCSDLGATIVGRQRADRRPARALPGAGRGRPVHRGRAGRPHRHRRAVRRASGCPARPPAATSATTPATDRYSLTAAQAFALADPDGPLLPGAFELALALPGRPSRAIVEAFRTGAGVAWDEHDEDVFTGCERFFRPGYVANLVSAWIPALDGVQAKLAAGAAVADVGCGHGASTMIMARDLPGLDVRRLRLPRRLDRGRARARGRAGVDDRALRGRRGAGLPRHRYDLVATFDCLHDMGDPVGAARHIRDALADDGTWLIVEPYAGDTVAENLNPVGPALLRVLHVPVRAARDLAGAAATRSATRPARRRSARSSRRPGSHVPPGRGDPVQPRVRGPPVTDVPRAYERYCGPELAVAQR